MLERQVGADLLASLSIDIIDDDESTQSSSAIVDTGFDGQLTLSSAAIEQLQLSQVGTRDVDLGDGSTAETEIYLGAVLWHDEPRPIMVLRGGDTPLIGMELMEHHRLIIDIERGGQLRLEELS